MNNFIDGKDLCLAFENISISSPNSNSPIISNVSGYVVNSGITAIIGPSASGKSLLMQSLCGRASDLAISGKVFLKGHRVDMNAANDFAYVPQEDILIGDLTAREMLTINASLKLDKAIDSIESIVEKLLKEFELDHVADNKIGTIFRRGLSGGQKKRVDVGIEFVAPPLVLFLDEPTSGLDGSMALEILKVIKRIVKSSEGKLSVILSIHQPNEAILSLFDHIMVLGNGGVMYFGTVPDSMEYFTAIGYPPPTGISPTDFYLKITDSGFSSNITFSFESSYSCSIHARRVHELIAASIAFAEDFIDPEETATASLESQPLISAETGMAFDNSSYEFTERVGETSFFRQTWTLLQRDFTLAGRDVTLYYLQLVLHSFYGFLVGAAFFQLEYNIDEKMTYILAGLCWIVFINSYIHVFKVYHLVVHQARIFHETKNGSYSIFAGWLSEYIGACILYVIFTPGFIIAYFMMGFPVKPFPFLLLSYWTSAVAGETLLNLLSIFFLDATAAIVSSQALLVVLTVFCGVFISWNDMPNYWIWLQESAAITQASRAAYVAVSSYIDYDCKLNPFGNCNGPTGEFFNCISSTVTATHCKVSGREVLWKLQGVGENESHWKYYGALLGITVALRLALLFFMYYPPRDVYSRLRRFVLSSDTLANQVTLKTLNMQMAYLLKQTHPSDEVSPLSPRAIKADNRLMRSESQEYREEFTALPPSDPSKGSKISKYGSQFFHGACTSCLRFTDINLTLKNTTTKLLSDVSAVCAPGRVMALMGPSGAGKTTLLNALSGRAPYADVTGNITFGNRPLIPADLMYVPQFDELLGVLTVQEQLMLIGDLKCTDKEGMRKRLPQLLRILGLYGKRNVPCGQLTGGELKRVSVGMGMIVSPNVLFLDEPTTGLDSSAAFSMVNYIVNVAEKTGVVVIMTIHQPSAMVFGMLQDLLLLESGGRMAFCGSNQEAALYFEELGYRCPRGVNPADYFLELIHDKPKAPADNKLPGQDELFHSDATWKSILEKKRPALFEQKAIELSKDQYIADTTSRLSQFRTQCVFFAKYYFRESGFYFYRLLFLIVVALFVGTMFLRLSPNTDNISKYAGALFFAVWAVLFSAIGSTGLTASNRLVSINMIQNGVVDPAVYVVSQFLLSLPYNLGCAIVFQSIMHWLVDMNPRAEPFFYAILITWGHLVYMEAIMAVVVQVLHDAMLSVVFSMICIGTLFLFPGFFVQVQDMPAWVSWISYIIGTKYSFDGYLSQVFHSQTFDVSGFSGITVSGDKILKDVFGNEDVNSWGMFGVLFAWVFFFRIIHLALFYYELRFFVSGKKMHKAASSPPDKKVVVDNKGEKAGGYVELAASSTTISPPVPTAGEDQA